MCWVQSMGERAEAAQGVAALQEQLTEATAAEKAKSNAGSDTTPSRIGTNILERFTSKVVLTLLLMILIYSIFFDVPQVDLRDSLYAAQLTSLDIEPEWTSLAGDLLQGRNVEFMTGDARDSLAELEAKGRRFDFVSLDADKVTWLYRHRLVATSSTFSLVCPFHGSYTLHQRKEVQYM